MPHECPGADKKHDTGYRKTVYNQSRIRQIPVQHHGTHLCDKGIQWVEMFDHPHQFVRQLRDRIENRRQIHPCGQKRRVDILHVPEKYGCLCQKKSQTKAKHIDLEQDDRDEQHVYLEPDMTDDKHDQHRSQREKRVHETAGHLGNRKNVFGNICFLQQGRVSRDGKQRLVRRLGDKVEDRLPRNQVHREVLDIKPEHVGKYQHHDDHDHQRVQDAP